MLKMFFRTGKIKLNDFISKSDEELLALSVSEPEIFSLLVDRYEDAFLRKGRYVLKHQEDAQDLVQEVFVRIYIHADSFNKQKGASFKSWAYKILLNQSFSFYKKAKRDKEFLLRIDKEIAENIPDQYTILQTEKKIDFDYVLSLISRLPITLERVLTLHFIHDRPQKEIAQTLGISEGAVRTRIHRAKEELKKEASFCVIS